MIAGIGVDIVNVAVIEDSISTYGDRYLERVFTTEEIEYCRSGANSSQRFAARVAAKEAAMKALGTGWESGVEWLSFEVKSEPSGRPILLLRGEAAEIAEQRGINHTWISLAHNPAYAIAEVVLEQN